MPGFDEQMDFEGDDDFSDIELGEEENIENSRHVPPLSVIGRSMGVQTAHEEEEKEYDVIASRYSDDGLIFNVPDGTGVDHSESSDASDSDTDEEFPTSAPLFSDSSDSENEEENSEAEEDELIIRTDRLLAQVEGYLAEIERDFPELKSPGPAASPSPQITQNLFRQAQAGSKQTQSIAKSDRGRRNSCRF